jgi:hypothetical protein
MIRTIRSGGEGMKERTPLRLGDFMLGSVESRVEYEQMLAG